MRSISTRLEDVCQQTTRRYPKLNWMLTDDERAERIMRILGASSLESLETKLRKDGVSDVSIESILGKLYALKGTHR